jgi:hypothetical protein
MNEALGERVHREFCWFALVLLALLIVCAGGRMVPSTLVSSTEARDDPSGSAAQPATTPR